VIPATGEPALSRIANRPLTKPSEPHRFADLAQVLAAILLLMIPAFLYASQRADLHHAERRIADLEQRLIELTERRKLLTLELDSELDPRRIDERAREVVGLQDPEPEQVVFLPRDPGDVSSPAPLLAHAAEEPHGHR
jgi:hypothetical protein